MMHNRVLVIAILMVLPETEVFSYEADVIFKFVSVHYNWNNAQQQQKAIQNGEYIVENNLITGIKVYKDQVYVTVPRWRNGVPATLNLVVPVVDSYPILEPFPDWDSNKIGDCNAFQYVQSMEIDPNTGYMWIIDTGRANTINPPSQPQNLCPPKLVIMDLDRANAIVRNYEFPDHVVSHSRNFMNDIVLDYEAGRARFAYITDTSEAKLYVYDYDRNISYFFQDLSMQAVPLDPITQDGLISAPIDGIAISPDFRTVYYSTLSALPMYAIPTEVLRNNGSEFGTHLRVVGNKTGGCDGMVFGQKHIFYASFEHDALYMAPAETGAFVSLTNQSEVVRNNKTAVWIDTLAFNGTDLWFVANALNSFSRNKMNFTGPETNIHIWKVNIGEVGYLQDAQARTNIQTNTISLKIPSVFITIMFAIISYTKHY